MQNRDSSFVKYLLSLSMLLPAATASAATLEPSGVDEARPAARVEAPNAAVAAKLSDLAQSAHEVAWINWTEWSEWGVVGPAEKDDAAHLSAADLLRSIKAEQA